MYWKVNIAYETNVSNYITTLDIMVHDLLSMSELRITVTFLLDSISVSLSISCKAVPLKVISLTVI